MKMSSQNNPDQVIKIDRATSTMSIRSNFVRYDSESFITVQGQSSKVCPDAKIRAQLDEFKNDLLKSINRNTDAQLAKLDKATKSNSQKDISWVSERIESDFKKKQKEIDSQKDNLKPIFNQIKNQVLKDYYDKTEEYFPKSSRTAGIEEKVNLKSDEETKEGIAKEIEETQKPTPQQVKLPELVPTSQKPPEPAQSSQSSSYESLSSEDSSGGKGGKRIKFNTTVSKTPMKEEIKSKTEEKQKSRRSSSSSSLSDSNTSSVLVFKTK